ncbi:hypothetical protein SAMN04489707_1001198 [Paenacidovorax caeni]|uniref:Uncharacterized protein n=1 Tax=Paenacidovorax caeni TaxID=343013 RepID=A0A1I7F688_9BURK|nr:hypothetical protein [Paenacidovorax caeni]SFU31640.1 hypothetical protein SAMN04489707_1001198 [Paenacidovorax caeni]
MLSTSVKWIRNDMRGAPVINGNTPGCLIAALDALLVTGWGTTTALSVSVSGGIATATVNAGSSFAEHAVVWVDGATPSALNGEARVLTASNTQITFATTAPDGVATGAITLKYAPAGWEKVDTRTNKAVYRSTDVTGARFYLRVDDSNGLFARVRGYETMSDIDTGTGLFPLDAQIATGGGYWHKSTASNTTAIPYLLAADAKLLLQAVCFGVANSANNTTTAVFGFGEGVALNPAGDAFATVLSATGSIGSGLQYGGLSGASTDSATSGAATFARGWQGLGSAVYARPVPEGGNVTMLSGSDGTLGIAPGRVDGAIRMARMMLKDQATNDLRAVVPGCHFVPQVLDNTPFPTPFALNDGAGALAGRKLAAVPVGQSSGSRSGTAFVDVTGPWR